MASKRKIESEQCGYCFASGGDMRQLPCRHTAHTECLQADFHILNLTECHTCKEQFASLDFSSLTAVVDSHPSKENKNEDTSVMLPNEDDTAACDVCKVSGKYEKAVAYCVDCEVKACDVHITEEHPKNDDGHETVDYDKYQTNPAVYKNVKCDEHNKRVTRYCTRCEMFGCTLCEDVLSCKKAYLFSDEVEMIQHQFIDISEKVQDIRATFNRESVNIADKLKTINESWKDVWPRLDTLEACCKSLVELIQCKVTNTYEQGTMQSTVKSYLKEKTDLVEVFSVQLMEKKDKLEELQSVIHRFLNFTHDTDIIKQWSTLQTQIADTLAIRVAYCEWKTPVLLDDNDMGISDNAFEIGFGIPSALTLEAKKHIGRHCYSVCYKPDGELVVGRDFTVQLYNKKHEVVREVGSKYPTSVVSANGKIYFTNSWNFGRVVVQTDQLDNPDNALDEGEELYRFSRSYTFNQMDVNENWSALVNGETSEVLLYNMTSGQSYTRSLFDTPNYVHFHPDADLLVTFSQAGKLKKYKIASDGYLTEVWTCFLPNPCGVCTDEMGLIFVRTGDSGAYSRMGTGAIYAVTKEGRKVKTFDNINIYSTLGGMSIYGDTLAVAGWNQRCYQLYKMSY